MEHSDKLLQIIATKITESFQENFRQGGRDKWQPSKLKQKGGSTLVESGNLRNSLDNNTIISGNEAIFYSEPYGAIHNEGGVIKQTPTKKQRGFFWAMYYETGDEAFKWMAMAKELNINIPKREFAVVPDEDWQGIEEIINDYFKNIDEEELKKILGI